jgi:enoyl-CoA hydratase/carnithine racemase
MAGYSDILVSENGPVALVTLSRPDKLNSMGGSMMSDLAHYLGITITVADSPSLSCLNGLST